MAIALIYRDFLGPLGHCDGANMHWFHGTGFWVNARYDDPFDFTGRLSNFRTCDEQS